jgi:hypothetical protein
MKRENSVKSMERFFPLKSAQMRAVAFTAA